LTSGLVSCSQAGGVNVNTGNLGAGGGLDIKLGN
jgi:hypothetical protein